jgi:hypothetical protein
VRKFATGPTDDPLLAIHRIVAEDGMSTGIMYQRDLPNLARTGDAPGGTLAEFESEFEL